MKSWMLEKKFFLLEVQILYPLLDLGFPSKKLIKELEEYSIGIFHSKVEVLKRLRIVPLLCEYFTKEAVEEAMKPGVNLCDISSLISRLYEGMV